MPEFAIAPDAADDLQEIAEYTIATWGVRRSTRYAAALTRCFRALANGTARVRHPLPDLPALEVCRCEHHFVFALRRDAAPILILAILHEQMDLMTRLRSRLE